MKTSIITSLLLSACVVLSSSNLNAQQQQQQTNQQNASQVGNTATAQPRVVKKVGFRMASWRTIHGDGTKATTDLVTTLQKIGCEVKQDNHGNHTDISFRCPSWKTVSVQNDDQSNQWHQWLVNNEFETVHARSAQQAQALKETYELIGCEAVVDNHGDHIDLKFRCPNWSTVALVNSQAAHVWQDWLNKSGFETQHDHSADGHDAHAGHNHGATGHEGHDHSKDDHSGHNHEGHDHK